MRCWWGMKVTSIPNITSSKLHLLLQDLAIFTNIHLPQRSLYQHPPKMAKLTLRLAILECDIPIDPILNKYGTYGDRFKERFGAAADSIKHPGISSKSGLEVSAYEVITAQVYPPLKDVDAILITGSQFTAFNDDPWILKLVQYVKDALKEDRIKVVGVCFGHQILGRALGATVKRGEAWEIAVAPVDLTKKGQEVFERPALVSLYHTMAMELELTRC